MMQWQGNQAFSNIWWLGEQAFNRHSDKMNIHCHRVMSFHYMTWWQGLEAFSISLFDMVTEWVGTECEMMSDRVGLWQVISIHSLTVVTEWSSIHNMTGWTNIHWMTGWASIHSMAQWLHKQTFTVWNDRVSERSL